jgi:hypothetical protein
MEEAHYNIAVYEGIYKSIEVAGPVNECQPTVWLIMIEECHECIYSKLGL